MRSFTGKWILFLLLCFPFFHMAKAAAEFSAESGLKHSTQVNSSQDAFITPLFFQYVEDSEDDAGGFFGIEPTHEFVLSDFSIFSQVVFTFSPRSVKDRSIYWLKYCNFRI